MGDLARRADGKGDEDGTTEDEGPEGSGKGKGKGKNDMTPSDPD